MLLFIVERGSMFHIASWTITVSLWAKHHWKALNLKLISNSLADDLLLVCTNLFLFIKIFHSVAAMQTPPPTLNPGGQLSLNTIPKSKEL